MTKNRRHGSHWDDGSGKNRMPDERVEKGGFAAFELTNARHIKSPLGNSFGNAASRGSDVIRSELGGQFSKPIELGLARKRELPWSRPC